MPKEHNLSGTWYFKFKNCFRRIGQHAWPIGLMLLAVGGLMAGCTSDIPSEVGTGLVNSEIDVVLEPLHLENIELYTAKNVKDDEVSLLNQEVLYFGSQDGNLSSILLNYDFTDIFSEEFPDTVWTLDNIAKVELRLVRLAAYGGILPGESDPGDTTVVSKYYQVFTLDEPFNGGNFPGPVPTHGNINLNTAYGENMDAAEPRLVFRAERLMSWVNAAQMQGLIVSDGPESSTGLIGFASNELTHVNELASIHADPGAFPVIIVAFNSTEEVAFIAPSADISTFHQIKPAPLDQADGMMLRTCLRTYPMLRFDFSSLPENVFINRAVLSITNNISTGFGQLESIVVSEIDVNLFGVPGDSMPLANLADAT